jgi:hypothetical protein
MAVDYICAVLVLWLIGYIVNLRQPEQKEDGEGWGSLWLLPLTAGKMFRAGQYKTRAQRVGTVVVALAIWLVAVVVLSGMVDQFRHGGLPGDCPAGQHLQGGQGGGEQYCE